MLAKDKNTLQNYVEAVQNEWIETNGIGGYASSTIIGTNTRRYHGLLIASMNAPVERVTMLSKLDETIICREEKFELGTNQYKDAVTPAGFNFIERFSKNLFPEWKYKLPNGIEIKKTIACVQGENTTLVIYEVLKAKDAFTLELMPLVSGKDFHSLMRANETVNSNALFENSVLNLKPYNNLPEFFISAEGASFKYEPYWYHNFEYLVEIYRGQEFTEDLFTHGKISKDLKKGDKLGIIISTKNPGAINALDLFEKEKSRKEKLIASGNNETEKTLTLAADQFVVQRGKDLKTIIAGYHWFSDWGRDTMIALPGLCLVTGRFDDAKKILSAFAKSVDKGMLPNRFPDYGDVPEYNSVDATLWFFIAIKKYMESSGDKKFVLKELLPVLKEIIDWHFKGTRFNIHANNDGLLEQGIDGEQLTWMDARVGNWVVTPRIGKAVEINALWYNALLIYAELLKMNGEKEIAKSFTTHADKIKNLFTEFYWNEEKQCLYDFVKDNYKDASIRPNQLFAISLSHQLIDGEKAKSILKVVTEKLYTPVGLRSLSQDHPDYKGRYRGNQLERDGAYHQGTVWSWLLGPYIDSIIRVKGAKGKAEAKKVIQNFSYHFNEDCIGSVSEIFDGDAPHAPRGCIAQAWSVGELLRVIKEYKLTEKKKTAPKKKTAEV
ncbi:MAG: amylo-alpha-1,6-glucosidase [Bacteroidia bacterium]